MLLNLEEQICHSLDHTPNTSDLPWQELVSIQFVERVSLDCAGHI